MPAHQYSLKNFRDLLATYVQHANTESARKGENDPATIIYQAELEHLLELKMGMDKLLESAPDAKHADQHEANQLKALKVLLDTAKEKSKQFHLDYILRRNKVHGRGTPGVLDETDGVPHDTLNFNNSRNFREGISTGSGTHAHKIIFMCSSALANGLLYINHQKPMDVYPLDKIKLIAKRIDESLQPIAKFLKRNWELLIPEESFLTTFANLFKSKPKPADDAKAQTGKDQKSGLGDITFGDAPVVAAGPAAPQPGGRTATSIN